ncbi:unnamed protein product, partial [marine sediment metagenome]
MRTPGRREVRVQQKGSLGRALCLSWRRGTGDAMKGSAGAGAILLLVASLPGSRVLAAETGMVYVKSVPAGAAVFVDRETRPRGRTPCFITKLPSGRHTIKARLAGYADLIETVVMTSGKVMKLEFTFGGTGTTAGGGRVQASVGAGSALGRFYELVKAGRYRDAQDAVRRAASKASAGSDAGILRAAS